MNRLRLSAGLASLLLLTTLPTPAQDSGVTFRTVKYPQLAERVVQNRGKVVVVDLWAFF